MVLYTQNQNSYVVTSYIYSPDSLSYGLHWHIMLAHSFTGNWPWCLQPTWPPSLCCLRVLLPVTDQLGKCEQVVAFITYQY